MAGEGTPPSHWGLAIGKDFHQGTRRWGGIEAVPRHVLSTFGAINEGTGNKPGPIGHDARRQERDDKSLRDQVAHERQVPCAEVEFLSSNDGAGGTGTGASAVTALPTTCAATPVLFRGQSQTASSAAGVCPRHQYP